MPQVAMGRHLLLASINHGSARSALQAQQAASDEGRQHMCSIHDQAKSLFTFEAVHNALWPQSAASANQSIIALSTALGARAAPRGRSLPTLIRSGRAGERHPELNDGFSASVHAQQPCGSGAGAPKPSTPVGGRPAAAVAGTAAIAAAARAMWAAADQPEGCGPAAGTGRASR